MSRTPLVLVLGIAIAFSRLATIWVPVDGFLAFAFGMGGSGTRKWRSALGVLGVLLISDGLIHGVTGWPFPYPGWILNYLSILSVFGLGAWIGRFRGSPKTFVTRWLGLQGGILAFFVFSNLGVFWAGNLYPHSWTGLMSCFVAALPFLKFQWLSNTLAWSAWLVFEPKEVPNPLAQKQETF
jgi:hypothetical protein